MKIDLTEYEIVFLIKDLQEHSRRQPNPIQAGAAYQEWKVRSDLALKIHKEWKNARDKI